MPAAAALSPMGVDASLLRANPISVYADEYKGRIMAAFPPSFGAPLYGNSSRNNPHPRSFYSLQTINGSFIPTCVETPRTQQYLSYMRKKPENKLERRIKRAIKDFLHDKNDDEDLEIYPQPGYTNPQNISTKPRLAKRGKETNNLPAGMKYFTHPEVYDNQVQETLRAKTPADQQWPTINGGGGLERPPSRPQSNAPKCLDEIYANGDVPRPMSQASAKEKYYDARLKQFVGTDGPAARRPPSTPMGIQRSHTTYPGLVSFERKDSAVQTGRQAPASARATQSADMTMQMLDRYQNNNQQPHPYTMTKRYPYTNTMLLSGIMPADYRCDASMFQNSNLVAPRHYNISPEWISEKYSVNKVGNRFISSNKLRYGMVHA